MRYPTLRQAIAALLVIASIACRAQDNSCDCGTHFDFVKSYMERNHAAFRDNVPGDRRAAYAKFCADISAVILKDHCKTHCSYFIDRYLKYFKDRHIYIEETFPSIDDQDTAAVNLFRQSYAFMHTERMVLDSQAMERLKHRKGDEIEGVYYSFPSDNYTIAVIKSSGCYKGVIIESSTKLWERGQVKFILSPILSPGKDPVFSVRLYLRDHSLQQKTVHFNTGTLTELFLSKNRQNAIKSAIPFEFRRLNENTHYLKVGSFNGPLFNLLDSCYKVHARQITESPYLVIDIRDNGGGADKCYQGLIDFAYTHPIANDIGEIYVTPDNLQVYQHELDKILADSVAYGEGAADDMRSYIKKMQRAKLYTFAAMDNDRVSYNTRDTVFANPRKIVVLYNRNTASSAESFILDAMQSRKVITAGENSGGYLGYGNVFAVAVPHSNMTLGCTTIRYRKRRKLEGVGIPPMVPLNPETDWVAEALKILDRR
ncbi:MAG: S41 family peptidase [Puia sp.]|nr:S41 family peptidase [Puia sp.]